MEDDPLGSWTECAAWLGLGLLLAVAVIGLAIGACWLLARWVG